MNSCKSSHIVDSLDNLYYREKNIFKNDKNLPDSFDDNIINELRQLDSNLNELFLLSNEEFNTHYAIHKYRLRLSRRISSYSSILKNLMKQCESVAYQQHRVKLYTLYQYYNDRLMRHKNKLSEWWSMNERRYHTLCLSSFISQVDNTEQFIEDEDLTYQEMTPSKNDNIVTKKLKDTRNMMITQINQMKATETSLLKSSNYISQQQDILKSLFTHINVPFEVQYIPSSYST